MARLLFAFSFPCVIVLTVSSFAFRALAYQQALPPFLIGFDVGCQMLDDPCWQGIVPGVTTLEETRQQLEEAGYQAGIENASLRYYYFYSKKLKPGCVKVGYAEGRTVLSYLRLYCMEGVRVGDVSSSLGIPQSVVYRYSIYGDAEFLTYNTSGRLSGLTIVVGAGWASPFNTISSLELFEVDRFDRLVTEASPWMGFLPMWRFCQLRPSYPRCS